MRFSRASIVARGALAAVFLSSALPATEVAAGAPPSSAGSEIVRIEVEFFEGGEPTPVNRATVYTSKRRVRVEQRGADASAAPPVFVYRGDQDRLYSIVESARTYVTIERAMLDRLGAGARIARREVDRQLEGVPQDQQRLYGHLLGSSQIDPSRPADPLVVARSGEMGEAAGYPCRRATISRSDRLLATGCVADWDVVGLTPEDVEVFRSLALLARDAMASRSPIPKELVPGQPLDLIVQLGGFPVYFERAGAVAGDNAVRVASVERIPADDSLFEVPADFTARSGMTGMASFASLLSRPGRATPTVMAAPSASPPASMGPAAIDAAQDPVEPARPTPRRADRWTPKPYRSISLFGDP